MQGQGRFARGGSVVMTAAALAVLGACASPTAPEPSPGATTTETATIDTVDPASTPPPAPVENEALVSVSGRATAPNGAAVDVTLTLDTLPAADSGMLAAVLAECYLRDNNWPPDAANALLWQQTIVAEPVAGTPSWPGGQELWLLTLASHGVASGDGATQLRTTSGRDAMCSSPDGNIRLIGPGTTRLTLFVAPSTALVGFGPDEVLSVSQFGFASGLDSATASAITDCRVAVSPQVEQARERGGLPWRTLFDYAPWAADGDFCGVGVPNDEIP